MSLPPIQQQATGSRFARELARAAAGRRYALEGDARPGDVLALAGGVRVEVDELVGFESGPVHRGGLIDVRG
jgi:hypothetical protein